MSQTDIPFAPPAANHLNMRLEDRLAEAIVLMSENAGWDIPFDAVMCARCIRGCRTYISLRPTEIVSGAVIVKIVDNSLVVDQVAVVCGPVARRESVK